MFFFGIGAADTGEDLRLSPATRALSSSLSIFILPRSPRPPRTCTVAEREGDRESPRNSSFRSRRKCPGRFRRTLKPFHPADRKSAISMLTRALSITLFAGRDLYRIILVAPPPSLSLASKLDFSVSRDRRCRYSAHLPGLLFLRRPSFLLAAATGMSPSFKRAV